MNNASNKPTLIEQIRDIFTKIDDMAQHSIFEMAKLVRDWSPEFRDYSDAELQEALKIAWNYEEEETDIFSLKDAIVWMKRNFDKSLYSGGCVYRVEAHHEEPHKVDQNDAKKPAIYGDSVEKASHDESKGRNPELICLHLCFLDKEGNPLLDGGARHKVVHCKMIDETLSRQFGNKDMIILK